MIISLLYAVIDTNVVFAGLTKQGGAAGLIIEAWLDGLFTACVSTAVAYEYVDVLQRKLSASKWTAARTTLATLLACAEATRIYYSWRPFSPDPGDDFLIDCAMNATAILVTANKKDFRIAEQYLGLVVMSPAEFVSFLATHLSQPRT